MSAACPGPRAHLALQEHQDPQEWWEEWDFLVKMAKMVRMVTEGTVEKKVHLAGQVTVENKDRRAKLEPLDEPGLVDPRESVVPRGNMAYRARRGLRARRGSLASQAPAAVAAAVPSQPSRWQ